MSVSGSPTGLRGEEPVWHGLSQVTWVRIGLVALALCGLFWPNFVRLWEKTNPITGEANWSHSIFVPLIGLYYLYINREELLAIKAKPAWTGLPIVLLGLLSLVYWYYPGQNDLFKDVSAVIIVFGVVVTLAGWRVMRIAWFPILFLVCALPWPGRVYSMVALPLQQLAAKAAVGALQITGVDAVSNGAKITVISTGRTLNVAEACAGLKSLMTFITVGGAIGFLSARPVWQKITITLSAVPIAIFCNVMRVTGQGLLDYYVDTRWSEGFAHAFVGLILLIPAFFLILLVAWILDHLFVEEAEARTAGAAGPTASAPDHAARSAALAEATRRLRGGTGTNGGAHHE